MTARYRIEHETHYAYASTVATSQHVAYLRPRELPYQHVVGSEVNVEPRPARRGQRPDYFGNLVDQFQLLRPHTELLVTSRSLVDVSDRWPSSLRVAGDRAPWEEVRDAVAASCTAAFAQVPRRATVSREVSQFAFPSPYVPPSPEIDAYARVSFAAGRPLLAAAIDLMHRIYAEFSFDPSATNVTTPVARVLAERRGVCQDFAHFQISCLRSLGLAARYVSGYLLTDPPPGQPRLVGADASHAWVSVYSPLAWLGRSRPDQRRRRVVAARDAGLGPRLRRRQPPARRAAGRVRAHAHRGVSVIPADEPPDSRTAAKDLA